MTCWWDWRAADSARVYTYGAEAQALSENLQVTELGLEPQSFESYIEAVE